jgi:ribosomal protein S18 acetylase RimI-like enzyme
MYIKIADINDLENLYELNRLFENETTKEQMEKYIKQNNHEIICIAYLDNIAVGYCTGLIIKSVCYKNCRVDIESLFVKEEYRRKGIGKALMTFMEKEAVSRNILHFHIITNKKNENTVKFYENIGYTQTGEILLDKTYINNK